MYTIRRVSKEEAAVIHHLGTEVYHTTYTAILSRDQIDFMLRKNYRPEAIQQSMLNGQDFYLIFQQETQPLGFIALQKKSEDILRIEKLYLLANNQGLGLGKQLIDFAVDQAEERGFSVVELNVNRGNKAYYFYLKQGFQVIEEVDIPYYGYVLDDYVMQKLVR
ncbi:GNAT family N-acetyltransferase [Sphingobacterium chuzhouense]|uniref:GNAT family N-acetyltransferase n=1 Tax=Sphingobacterium chuzhouense TaxID=1742264 RepID=A0ABR7XQA8_9SPHI|nr:GNAT family N-acetyltransferase [Sphingobacterium chuzhouense]MBD1421057.1 GNAT family N-acetyltransferase [Sphingobacterium chuzhouense]